MVDLTKTVKAAILKQWENVALHQSIASSLSPHEVVQGLYKYQPKAWYSKGLPFYIKSTPEPGKVVNVEKREKNGLKYFFMTPSEKQEFDSALLVFNSGDLWRSSYDLKILDGEAELLTSACGGSRGGAHYAEVYVYIAKIGTVFREFNAGFKSRRPRTTVYQLQKRKMALTYKNGKLYDIRDEAPEWALEDPKTYEVKHRVLPVLVELGDAEDYAVLTDL